MIPTLIPAALLAVTAATDHTTWSIDGSFDDWADIATILDDSDDTPDGLLDWGVLKARHTNRYVDLLIETDRELNIQRLPGRALLVLDSDGSAETGTTTHGVDGADVVIEMSPASSRGGSPVGMGVAMHATVPPGNATAPPSINPYATGLMFAPTYAHPMIELRLNRNASARGLRRFLGGSAFTGRLVVTDPAGEIIDQTGVFTYDLAGGALVPAVAPMNMDPLDRPRGDTTRVLCWNVEKGNLFENSGPFIRIIKTLDPDIILFQELRNSNMAAHLRAFINETLPSDREWFVLRGDGGGNLRCAVLTRLPARIAPALKRVFLEDSPNRDVRVAGAIVQVGDRRLLVGSMHLKCCGEIGSSEDEKRLAEVAAINKAIRKQMATVPIDGIVLGGDLNLVGGIQPLETLIDDLDSDGSDLTVANPRHLTGGSNITWRDKDTPFQPGRLDFLMYSDDSLIARRAFICDSVDVPPFWLQFHGIRLDDTRAASDHLPIVLDLEWTAGPAAGHD